MQIFPAHGTRKLRVKLITQRNRVVIVHQHEVLAHRELQPPLKDMPVLDPARDSPDIKFSAIALKVHAGKYARNPLNPP